MIAKKAYIGNKFLYRAYFNGEVIWDYGVYVSGLAEASTDGSGLPVSQEPDSIQLLATGTHDAVGTPEVWELDPVHAHADATLTGNASPAAVETVHPAGTASAVLYAKGAPATFGHSFGAGRAAGTFAAQALPHAADIVYGLGTADGTFASSLCPTVAEVLQILLDAGVTIDGTATPQLQEPEAVIGNTESELTAVCAPVALPLYKVTFMRDGVELYSTKVIEGYACTDPVTAGIIDTPTKEMDVQYTYEYSGWTLTDGGEADADSVSNILSNITENTVIYAAFTASVRYYTVTYYDDDGVTVLKTISLAYGATPSTYTPTKTGYVFSGWYPEVAEITGDVSYYAVWEEKVAFATASWERIAEISEAGDAAKHFALGNSKEVTLSDGTVVTLQIIGFNHDDLADGSGKAGITLLSKYVLVGTAYSKLHSSTTATNWSNCYLRTYLNGNFTTLLPEDFMNVVKPVTKVTTITGNKKTSTHTTSDTFWLLSGKEVGFASLSSSYVGTEGTRYSMFNSASSYSSLDNDLNKTTREGTYAVYYLRTPYNSSSLYYANMIRGSSSSYYASMCSNPAYSSNAVYNNWGTVFGCCI